MPILMKYLPLLFALTGSPSQHAEAPAEVIAPSSRDYETLLREYEGAEKAYKRELRGADRETRKALRKDPPARRFFARFEALAEGGDGQALLWTLIHVKDKGLGIRATREVRRKGYATLFAAHAQAPWFDQVLDQLLRDRKYLGTEELVRVYEKVLAENASRNIQAQAMHQLSIELRRTEEEADVARAEELLERVLAEYGDTEYANSADNDLFVEARLSVGREAPDFAGKTIDGYEFKLSDYRGKVVLVDFYGFW